MATDPPSPRARTNTGCVLLLAVLGVVVVLVGLLVWAFGWLDDRTPWAGRAILAVIVIGACARIVQELVTPARSRTTSDLVAAGLVVALAVVILYFGVARPALRDRDRDVTFAARLAHQRAMADGFEAALRELPDPESADPAEIRAAIMRARKRLAQVPDPDPDSLGRDEYEGYTKAQRAELVAELSRAVAAMQAFQERRTILQAILEKHKDKKDKP